MERQLWKAIVAGTAALAIAGTSLVYAQRGRDEGRQRWQPNTEDFRAFGEARLAGLKARTLPAGLQLRHSEVAG